MKKVIYVLALAGVGLTRDLSIGIGSRMQNNLNTYDLSCDNAQGSVKYSVDGLPNGVNFSGTTIVVSNAAKAGSYTIRVKAVDQTGQSAQRIITLTISQSSFQNGNQQRAQQLIQQIGIIGNNFGNNANSNNNNNVGTISNGVLLNGNQGNSFNGRVISTGNQFNSVNSISVVSTSQQSSVGSQSSNPAGQGSGTQGAVNPNLTGSVNSNPSGSAPNRLDNILSSLSLNPSAPGGSGNPGAPGNPGNPGVPGGAGSPGSGIPAYPGNRYPQLNLPTAADPTLYNPLPLTITTDKATPSQSNRNQITPDDITLRAASDRHQNAIKGITNLLKIIDQARANKDKAQSDIQTYTSAYNDAVAAQRTAQNDIIAAQSKVSQIVSAINSLTANIQDLKNRINQAVAQKDALNKQKISNTAVISGLQSTKAGLLDKLKGLDDQVGQKAKQLSDKNAQCQQINDSVNQKTNELNTAQQDLVNIESTRQIKLDDVNNKAAIVDDLRKKVQQAETDLADAKIKLADLDAKKLSLPVQIVSLKKQLETLQAKAKACADQAARLQSLINSLKGDNYVGLTTDINNLDSKIQASRSKVTEIDAQLASSLGPLQDLKAKLAQANEDFQYIRNQKLDADTTLRTAYQRGNDANNRVAFAKQNLDAIIKRFQDESKIVSDATLNLERARAQQALARQGLQDLIAHYSDALPYAIVPNGNGATNPGTPYGNNLSGSPLGPINQGGNGAPGSFRVTNWVSYLSTAYGAGVSLAYPGSVTELFPFNFLSSVSGNMAQNTNVNNVYAGVNGVNSGAGQDYNNGGRIDGNGNISTNGNSGGNNGMGGGCGGSGSIGQRVTTGSVVQVRSDGFDVKTANGQIYTIKVAPCTRLNANKANYNMKVGHQAIVKGYQDQNKQSQWNGDQITCLE